MLGPDAVFTGALTGGRGPDDRAVLVAWGDSPPTPPATEPWPGAHPEPPPALVHRPPRPATVTDLAGRPVGVSARGQLSAVPELVSVDGAPPSVVVAWAGPWLLDERWWDPGGARRVARFQLLAEDQRAYLCAVERNRWFVEGTYD
jgi:protein ImuB